jgi:hypothetical protein
MVFIKYKNNQLMLHSEIVICFEICTKQINILCGEKGEFLNVKPWWYIKYVKGIGEL